MSPPPSNVPPPLVVGNMPNAFILHARVLFQKLIQCQNVFIGRQTYGTYLKQTQHAQ